ncbi:MAG TPA: alpha/beta hydrolase [Acidimicrobiales bacterium]|nr:alpha/beta hydrolase [Acidimicrobiales bacterium]
MTPTSVLIHGTGDTSRGWRKVQAALAHPSVAIDLLGRREHPFDLSRATAEMTATVAANDVALRCDGPVVVVAHSGGGILAPRIAGALGDRVRHMVFIAALVAPDGGQAIDVLFPERREQMAKRRPGVLQKYHNHTFVQRDEDLDFIDGLEPLRDAVQVQAVESMNMLFRPVSWAGVEPDMPRTFVRPLRDKHHPPDVQQRLIEACAASEVIDIDSGHTPARDAPRELARILDEIASRYPQ